jgi:hypothetical protein
VVRTKVKRWKGREKKQVCYGGVQLYSIGVRVCPCRRVSPTRRDFTWCRIVGFRLQIPTI